MKAITNDQSWPQKKRLQFRADSPLFPAGWKPEGDFDWSKYQSFADLGQSGERKSHPFDCVAISTVGSWSFPASSQSLPRGRKVGFRCWCPEISAFRVYFWWVQNASLSSLESIFMILSIRVCVDDNIFNQWKSIRGRRIIGCTSLRRRMTLSSLSFRRQAKDFSIRKISKDSRPSSEIFQRVSTASQAALNNILGRTMDKLKKEYDENMG